MNVTLSFGPGQRKRVEGASAVIVCNEFGDPITVTMTVNNAIVFAARGDKDFERYLLLAGVKVTDTSVQRIVLPR